MNKMNSKILDAEGDGGAVAQGEADTFDPSEAVMRAQQACTAADKAAYDKGYAAALAAQPRVPDGWVLVPLNFTIDAEVWEAAEFTFGGPGTGEDDPFMSCTAWVGEIDEDDGTKTHGLHIACNECLEEGSITLAKFAAAPSPGESA